MQGTLSGRGALANLDPTDRLNLYTYCENNPVNLVDPSGLWTEDGVVRTYERIYKDNPKAMIALFIVLSHFELEQADYWADDYGPPDFERGVIPIARTAWFGSERSDENAADQLYEIMWRYFPELGLPRTWSRLAYDLSVGATKTVAGSVGAVVLGAGAVADPEPVTKVTAAGGAVVSADFAVEGVTQMIGTGGAGGVSLIQEAAGWYGRTVNGVEGEITARRAIGVAQFAFGLAGGFTKSKIGTTKFQPKNLRGSLADLKAAGIQDLRALRSGSKSLQDAFKRYKARFLKGPKGIGRLKGFTSSETAMIRQAEKALRDAGYDVSQFKELIRADIPPGFRGMSLDDGASLGKEAFSSQRMLNHVLEEELLHLQQKAAGLGKQFGPGTARNLEEAADATRRFPLPE